MTAPLITDHVFRAAYRDSKRTGKCAYMNCRLTRAAHARAAGGQGRRSWL